MTKNAPSSSALHKDMLASKERAIVFLKEWFFKSILFALVGK
ncbi:hypothetical protein HPHPH42_0298 [Helicobacter pylori Hp H-42]|uniref:Uncharacterized protein n=1 Tax=Helicobacter pylori Hp H-42 TaxID=992047 RepID=A0AB33XHY5_HELPX|nr:hypothetical protein HPHPH42_0298 [Helicobacter pylori Hp H-42]